MTKPEQIEMNQQIVSTSFSIKDHN